MSTPKMFAQMLPSFRLIPKRNASSIARHVRCYTKLSTAPLPASPAKPAQSPVRRSPWPSPLQRRPFSASAAVSHGHIDPPKPGEECVLPIAPGLYVAPADNPQGST
jgi:hypothetical protein